MEDYFSYTANPRLSKSASETLACYIKDYDRSDTGFSTCGSLGSKSTRRNYCSTLKNSLQKGGTTDISGLTTDQRYCSKARDGFTDLTALDEEIILARKLFSNEQLDWRTEDVSMTTEELLLEQPNHSFGSSSSEVRFL